MLLSKNLKLSLVALLFAVFTLAPIVYANYSDPDGFNPPNCPAGSPGCAAPIHTGSEPQTKAGSLQVNGVVSGYEAVTGRGIFYAAQMFNPTSGPNPFHATPEASPGGFAAGTMYYNGSKFRCNEAGGWKDCVGGGTGGGSFWGGTLTGNINSLNTGNVGIGIANPTAKLHVAGNMKINSVNTLEFGAGVAGKEINAGTIGYQNFTTGSNSLNIVGAGTTNSNRIVRIYDKLKVPSVHTDEFCHSDGTNCKPFEDAVGGSNWTVGTGVDAANIFRATGRVGIGLSSLNGYTDTTSKLFVNGSVNAQGIVNSFGFNAGIGQIVGGSNLTHGAAITGINNTSGTGWSPILTGIVSPISTNQGAALQVLGNSMIKGSIIGANGAFKVFEDGRVSVKGYPGATIARGDLDVNGSLFSNNSYVVSGPVTNNSAGYYLPNSTETGQALTSGNPGGMLERWGLERNTDALWLKASGRNLVAVQPANIAVSGRDETRLFTDFKVNLPSTEGYPAGNDELTLSLEGSVPVLDVSEGLIRGDWVHAENIVKMGPTDPAQVVSGTCGSVGDIGKMAFVANGGGAGNDQFKVCARTGNTFSWHVVQMTPGVGTTVIPEPIPQSVDLKINGSDGSIIATEGSQATLSWTSANIPAGTSCSLSGAINVGGLAVTGPRSVTVGVSRPQLYTYTITCGSATDSVSVESVSNPSVSATVDLKARLWSGSTLLDGLTITVDPSDARTDDIRLEWSITPEDSVSCDQSWDGDGDNVSQSGFNNVNVGMTPGQRVYTINCGNNVQDSVVVNVNQAVATVPDFTFTTIGGTYDCTYGVCYTNAMRAPLRSGTQAYTLNWNVPTTGFTNCYSSSEPNVSSWSDNANIPFGVNNRTVSLINDTVVNGTSYTLSLSCVASGGTTVTKAITFNDGVVGI